MSNTTFINVDNKLFSENIIFKVVYWYSGDYEVNLIKKDFAIQIEFTKTEGVFIPEEEKTLKKEVLSKLIDFKTREIVINETKSIRDLIILKAFFHFDEIDKKELESYLG